MNFATLIALVGMTAAIRITGGECAAGPAGEECRFNLKGAEAAMGYGLHQGEACVVGTAGDDCRAAAKAAKLADAACVVGTEGDACRAAAKAKAAK